MKLSISLIFVILMFYSFDAKSQKSNPPNISQLQNWADTKSYSKFSLEVRKLGYKFIQIDTIYSFDERIKANREIYSYLYEREVLLSSKFKTWDKIMYRITPSDKNHISIQFGTLTTDLLTFYSDTLKKLYKEADCHVKDDKKETSFCYNNSVYTIRIIDERVELSGEETNSYTIVLYRTISK